MPSSAPLSGKTVFPGVGHAVLHANGAVPQLDTVQLDLAHCGAFTHADAQPTAMPTSPSPAKKTTTSPTPKKPSPHPRPRHRGRQGRPPAPARPGSRSTTSANRRQTRDRHKQHEGGERPDRKARMVGPVEVGGLVGHHSHEPVGGPAAQECGREGRPPMPYALDHLPRPLPSDITSPPDEWRMGLTQLASGGPATAPNGCAYNTTCAPSPTAASASNTDNTSNPAPT